MCQALIPSQGPVVAQLRRWYVVVQANRRAQSSNPCELILSRNDEDWGNGRTLCGMQSNGGSSNFACLENMLEAEWAGSVQSFVSRCKP